MGVPVHLALSHALISIKCCVWKCWVTHSFENKWVFDSSVKNGKIRLLLQNILRFNIFHVLINCCDRSMIVYFYVEPIELKEKKWRNGKYFQSSDAYRFLNIVIDIQCKSRRGPKQWDRAVLHARKTHVSISNKSCRLVESRINKERMAYETTQASKLIHFSLIKSIDVIGVTHLCYTGMLTRTPDLASIVLYKNKQYNLWTKCSIYPLYGSLTKEKIGNKTQLLGFENLHPAKMKH